MNNIISVDSYEPKEEDKFFFDANIWMYLYCPLGNYKKKIIEKYDGFLKRIIENKASIILSSLVLSEFFNAYLRLEFNILKGNEPDKYKDFKKDFKGSKDYQKLMIDIKSTCKNHILKLGKRVDDKFSALDIDRFLKNIELHDFNDKYYISLAEYEGLKIVTNDKDFRKTKIDIPILTANRRLLMNT
jgi:predicted nucleic acid-binding protein